MNYKMIFLEGERMYLRALEPKDAEGPYPWWLNDPEVCLFNSHGRWPYSPAKAVEYINAVAESRSELVLAMVLREGDRHIGNISLQNIDWIDRSAEFAILLGDRDAWGNGYSKEASFLICRHGFQELNLWRIYCGTSIKNIAMQHLAAYLGMEMEGRRRQAIFKHGEYCDIVEYGVLREEFSVKFSGSTIGGK